MTAPTPPTADSAAFRAVMSRWATGVSIVTARAGGVDAGLTVNSFQSVSLHPPSVFVSLTHDTDTLPVIERSGHFGVSFLSVDQRALSERFARTIPAPEKFLGVALHRGPAGSALLDGHIGALEARLVQRLPLYDHVLLIGEATHVEAGTDALPLLYFRSGYAEADGADRLRPPPRRP